MVFDFSFFLSLLWGLIGAFLFYLFCGFVDIKRNDNLDRETILKYFLKSGRTTWHLAPLNLLMDLFCWGNRYIYQLSDLSDECQAEVKGLIGTFEAKKELIFSELAEKVKGKQKGMIFFKWYDKNIENSFTIPEFHAQYKHIRTIGVSVFNAGQATAAHFGPLRATLRLLYNFTPVNDDSVYIQVGRRRHIWHKEPLFIFDDTLLHQSCNGSDQPRYCIFVDILRPTFAPRFMDLMVKLVQVVFINFNRIFYKHWEFIH